MKQKHSWVVTNKTSQAYTMLTMVEYVVENMSLWSLNSTESETTFYRQLASILDAVLQSTAIYMADGDTTLTVTKNMVELNKAVFNTDKLTQSYGCKIDLIFRVRFKNDDRYRVKRMEATNSVKRRSG
ncbi:hypothetical protein DM01DRAFT_1129150 [Hesseltinella vesiculosa]|uniref:Uncharacterized protein n=1 Tax=Hesseltinella vesiculosa TaxID=101127 RepID=A0A1X2GUV7_9FUNG|nr:hypothetical protein DM01DRAFT_1129150 [Hesseltinella vesiculosa]